MGTKKVLLVEDNEMNREMLVRRLAKRGYDVEVAVDGEQAVESFSSVAPDIVLMDMSLPNMDGLEATRRIKSDSSGKHTPVIMLTANATVSDQENAFAAGCDEFETKPVRLAQLEEKMTSCLNRVVAAAD